MRRSLAIGLIVFALSLLLQVAAIGEMNQVDDINNDFSEISDTYNKHSLRNLIIKKAEFDAICNTIIMTLAKLPECDGCPAAKLADLKLKKAARELERFNESLTSDIPDLQYLDLKEKSAIGTIYRSIRDDAYSIGTTLDRWRLRLEELLNNPWVIGAIVVSAIAVPLEIADDNINEICFSVDNEEECNLIGCYWYSNQQNSDGFCGDWP